MDETRVEEGKIGERNDGGIFDFFCCRAGDEAGWRASARAELPVDGTINGRDTRLFWIGNFQISQCLCASRER